jgi:hypothetical protein
MQIVAAALGGLGIVAAILALNNGAPLLWNPLSGNPFGR